MVWGVSTDRTKVETSSGESVKQMQLLADSIIIYACQCVKRT